MSHCEEELPECFGDYTFCDKCNWCPYRDNCKLETEEIDEELEWWAQLPEDDP